MEDENITAKPLPDPIPIPLTKKLYAYCVHCAGTGQVTLTNGDQPTTTVPCEYCVGEGKMLFGEVEV